MTKFKKYDIIVRWKNGRFGGRDIGELFLVDSICSMGVVNNGYTHAYFNVRLATKAEIKAYNRGIRNINDIVSRGTYIQIY